MEKKSIIRLPKGKVAKNVQYNCVDGSIEVSYEVEDKFQPKDGDFVVSKDGKTFIFNGKSTDNMYGAYCGVNSFDEIIKDVHTSIWTYKDGCRPATFIEAHNFLSRLEEECGKAWDSKNKKLVDVIKPNPGDFLISKNKGIFIFLNKKDGLYCGVYEVKDTEGNHNGYTTSVKIASMLELRYATEEEKKEFLDFIRMEFSKEWNEEKLCFEDVYVPKFGDIVKVIDEPRYKRDYMICIYPKREEPWNGRYIQGFFNIANLDLEGRLSFECGNKNDGNLHIIPASESEKQELFDKLKKVGKRWNPETKKIEDIRWDPKQNEYYFYINPYGEISKTIYNTVIDSYIIGIGNAFKTEEDAKPYADKIKEIFKNSKPE